MEWEDVNRLCDVVRETSFAIHTIIEVGISKKYMRMHSFTDLESTDCV